MTLEGQTQGHLHFKSLVTCMLYIYLPVLYYQGNLCHKRGLCRRAGFSDVSVIFLVYFVMLFFEFSLDFKHTSLMNIAMMGKDGIIFDNPPRT